ncbi:MAG: TonB-dependent receptor [Prevotella sp.]|nr:TonB-dependent receptor [Prevotella sp.]
MTQFRSFLLILALWVAETVLGQQITFTIRGTISDDKGRGIELATVSLNQSLVTGSGRGGKFELKNVPAGTYSYRVSFVGYETATGTLTVKTGRETLNVKLQELGLELKNVVVTAKQVQMGSKSIIDQDAIRHIQPKSIGDMLQLVPGNLIENPNLNNLSQAHIREIEDVQSGNKIVYNAANARGTAVIVDGTPLSNDGNLQVFNANRYGSSADSNRSTLGENATGGQGTDLRTVSAGNVESMEVIRGIPSVEYGNLTSGVIIVNTKSGHTPWEVKASADPNSKLAFLGKGFNLTAGGAVNFSVDWAQSWGDTRQHYKGYDRLTATVGYSNQFGAVSFNARGAFFTSINNTKRDPQMTEAYSEWKNNNTGGRLAINGRYQSDRTFITSVDYKLSGQLSHQHDWKSSWIYNPDGVITNTREEGLQPARFKRYGYNCEYEIESIPVNVYAQLVANKYISLNDRDYTNLKLGAEYVYDGNVGDGLTYDTENPPQAGGSHTLRPRAYKDIPGQSTLTAFLSDRTLLTLGTMSAQIEAGVRLSNLFLNKEKSGGNSGYFVVEPRLNASVNLLNRRNNSLVDDLSLTGGFGLSNKLPPLIYLYPDVAYFDNHALARWSDDEADRLALVQTTIVRNTQNPDLKPTRSRKWEVGLQFRKGQVSGTLTYFNEHHQDEFGFATQPLWIDYPYFTLPDGAKTPTFDAATGNVNYTLNGQQGTATKTIYTERLSWSLPSNTMQSDKHGIEYTLDLGELKALRTSLNITGAWFWIKRKSLTEKYDNIQVDTRRSTPFEYMVVLPAGGGTSDRGSINDRINTNFAFITHIPQLKMIFTTTLQVVWRQSSQVIYEDEQGNSRFYLKHYDDADYWVADPLGYYDMQKNWHEWTPADAEDKTLNTYMARQMSYGLEKEVINPWAMLSMRFTKELGKTAEVSFIANNLTNANKYRRYKHSNEQYQVYPPMYFGAEVKLKF